MEAAVKRLEEDANRVFVGTPEQRLSFLEQRHQSGGSVDGVSSYRVKVRHNEKRDGGSRREALAREILGELKRVERS